MEYTTKLGYRTSYGRQPSHYGNDDNTFRYHTDDSKSQRSDHHKQ